MNICFKYKLLNYRFLYYYTFVKDDAAYGYANLERYS